MQPVTPQADQRHFPVLPKRDHSSVINVETAKKQKQKQKKEQRRESKHTRIARYMYFEIPNTTRAA